MKKCRSFRGVLSLWTRTPMFRIERGPLVIQTLAVCLAAHAFEQVEFVTDDRGAALARQLGWEFSAGINCALERFEAPDTAHIWALGKLATLSMQEQPCVQFDGDVLLFKPLPERLSRARLLAQSPDPAHYYTSPDMQRGRVISGLPPGACAFNAGLLGGCDVALVRAYAFAALELATKFRGSDLNGTSTSMIIEQYHLGVFAERCLIKVGTLLPVQPTRVEVEEAGYAHLVGAAKRHPHYIARAELRLQRDFPEAWERFTAGWSGLAALAADRPFSGESNLAFNL